MTDAYTPAPPELPPAVPFTRSAYVMVGVWSGMVLTFFALYAWISATSSG